MEHFDYLIADDYRNSLPCSRTKHCQQLMESRYPRDELSFDAGRLMVHVSPSTLTSDVIGDEDFLALDDDKTDMSTGSIASLWCGRNDFALETLLRSALTKSKRIAERSQEQPMEHSIATLQQDRSRLSQASSQTTTKSEVLQILALSDVSYVVPPNQPIGSNPGVSSRGTEIEIESQEPQQNLYCRHIFATKEVDKAIDYCEPFVSQHEGVHYAAVQHRGFSMFDVETSIETSEEVKAP